VERSSLVVSENELSDTGCKMLAFAMIRQAILEADYSWLYSKSGGLFYARLIGIELPTQEEMITAHAEYLADVRLRCVSRRRPCVSMTAILEAVTV
jgi:hypothetical protein